MHLHKYIFLCLGCLYLQSTFAQNGESLFDPTILHEIRLNFEQPNYWDSLTVNYQNWVADQSSDDVYTEADILIDGFPLESVGIRFKGLASYYYVDGLKKPMKVDLNEFIDGQEYLGIKKFNLHNGACDPSMMRDFVAFDVMRKAGVKAPRMSHAKLFINDEFWGVYGIIEQIDKTFVHENFADKGGNLYKNNGWSELKWFGDDPVEYQDDFQLKTNEEESDWSNFIHFLDVLNNTSDEEFATEIERVFDVNLFLHTMAADVLLNNWDSYLENERNWYFYHEPSSGKMHWIPWDYNLSLGGHYHQEGNPYPPIDPECNLITDFAYSRNGNTLTFEPKSNQEINVWLWDFGDNGTAISPNPVHTFPDDGEFQVCFTGGIFQPDGSLCQQRRCQKIDLSFNPNSCNSIDNGSSPYPSTDPIYQQVVAQDDYCCNGEWDAVCDLQYYQILSNQDTTFETGVEYYWDLPLVLDNPNKVLVDRILGVPAFREKYFDITCVLLENNFTEERLFEIIDQQSALIKDAIYEDPNYIFTWDYFEYDLGDGSGGGNDAEIPAIKSVISERIEQVSEDLQNWNQDCEDAFSPIGWQEVVINEFMASNSEDSEILDPSGDAADWIELYNNSDVEIDLTNFYLSDDENDLYKWQFPIGTIISPDDYLIIWADKDEDEEGIHTNFKLSKSGESLIISHEDGTVIDQLIYEEQITDASSARIPNGTGDFVIQIPTFNGNNEQPNATSALTENTPFQVYPNPANQFLYIQFSEQISKNTTIHFKNAMGQNVLPNVKIQHQNQRLNLQSLPAGIYYLEIETDDSIWVERIALQK